ncbi:TetR/AcrR family transcriptional regulator [Nocardioides sp.]|uniref:TetR/AcrR family transcriptional regulator n=1 Tax=Nocardioides sp. TaxID=35761 RepID=UPI00271B3094|nr:TetR/AcrR family transcriptional regulator [Nocardioides sp.]MDO9455995.1 TetR/AcrR family transcriptional regulator [Nocardioides sp.]
MTASTRIRLTPDERRAQLLDLGVRLLADRSLDELSIDLLAEEAGISRGLLYHYFGNKHAFHEAVVRRAVDDLVAQTAPQPDAGDPLATLAASMTAYVDYVEANHAGYVSLVKGAQGGNETLRAIYDEARGVLTDRIFTEDAQADLIPDTPAIRLLVRGWAAMAEELVLSWVADPAGVSRAELLQLLASSLPALVEGATA